MNETKTFRPAGTVTDWLTLELGSPTWQDQWAGTYKRLSIWPTLHVEPDKRQGREAESVWGCTCVKATNNPQRKSWCGGRNNLIGCVKIEWMKKKNCSQESSRRQVILWCLLMLKEYHLSTDHFIGCSCFWILLTFSFCFVFFTFFGIKLTQSMLFLFPEHSIASEKYLLNLNSNLWHCWADGKEENPQKRKAEKTNR